MENVYDSVATSEALKIHRCLNFDTLLSQQKKLIPIFWGAILENLNLPSPKSNINTNIKINNNINTSTIIATPTSMPAISTSNRPRRVN